MWREDGRRADLNEAERELLTAARTGSQLTLRFGDQVRDSPLRAEVLVGLLARLSDTRNVRSVRLIRARITGVVDLCAATVNFPLELRDCDFDAPVLLAEAHMAAVRLPGCRLPRLDATQLRSDGNVELDHGFTVVAGVCLTGARIDGFLSLSKASLAHDAGPALDADRIRVGQGVFGQDFHTATGEVRLVDAQITGPVVFDDAKLNNPLGCALNLNGSVVDAGVSLRGLTATGEVRLAGSRINGDLVLRKTRLNNADGVALKAHSLTVSRSLLADELTAHGQMNLIGAQIGGSLLLRNIVLNHKAGWSLLLIETEAAIATLRPSPDSVGAISLRDARFGRFTDDPLNWPEQCTVELAGMTYQRLTVRSSDLVPCPIPARLVWMQRYSIVAPSRATSPAPMPARPAFHPAPYAQLATALHRDGLEKEARLVLRFKERHRYRAMGPVATVWGTLQDITVGFGHRPALALAWLTGLLVTGTTYFTLVGELPAVKKGEAPTWDPFVYSLDLIVPVIDLGHEKAWDPTGWSKVVALTLIIGGWILATTVVAGAGRILNRK